MKKAIATGLVLLSLGGTITAQDRYPAPKYYQNLGDSLIMLMHKAKLTSALKDSVNQYDEAVRYFCGISKYFFQPKDKPFTKFAYPELPVSFAKAVMTQESWGRKLAMSPADAMGLFQPLPTTAQHILDNGGNEPWAVGFRDWVKENMYRSYFNHEYIDTSKVFNFDPEHPEPLNNPYFNAAVSIYGLDYLFVKYQGDFEKVKCAWNSSEEWSDRTNGKLKNAENLFFRGIIKTYHKHWKNEEK